MATAVLVRALNRTREDAAQTVIVTLILALFAHGEVERHKLVRSGTLNNSPGESIHRLHR